MGMRVRHAVMLGPSRELCGTTPEQFGDLLSRLAPGVEAAYEARARRPGRQRALGGGDKPHPFWLRLLVALTHLRQGTTTRATAAIFGIHERSVRRYRDEVVRLLAEHGCQPPGAARPLRTLDDLRAHLDALETEAVMVDGTEVPRTMPVDWDAQRAAWSGKSKDHVVKGTVVADASRRPLWFEANPTDEGRTHDITMLRMQLGLVGVLAATAATVLADKAYVGLRHDIDPNRVLTPQKAPRGGTLDDLARMVNHDLSSLRMPVEHAVGRMKWWKAMRHWRAATERFGPTGKAIAVLASIT
jgi:DDE superfamily endonuclease/Helix-turn-helix of DDE superfamily endonuclease